MTFNKRLVECLFSSITKYSSQKYTAFLKCDLEKNEILSKNANMLMIMWLMSAQYDAEKASLIPFKLEERLGSCDMKFIAGLTLERIIHAMTCPDTIHRFPKSVPTIYIAWQNSSQLNTEVLPKISGEILQVRKLKNAFGKSRGSAPNSRQWCL